MSDPAPRVTYATLAAGQSEEFRRRFDAALETLRPGLGHEHPHLIDGQGVKDGALFEDRSPADTRLILGRFPFGTPADVDRAVQAARRGFRDWSRRHWRDRCAVLRRAAELIEERGFALSALVSVEAGKNRLEA